MFSSKQILASFVVLAGVSNAQLSSLTSSCKSSVTSFVLGDLGNCLSLTSLVPVLSASGSILPSLDSYFGTVCSNSQCSNSTIASALSTVESSCSADISNGTSIVVALEDVLNNYGTVYNVACLEDTSDNSRCLIQTAYDIQNATGTPITASWIQSLLSGNSTALQEISQLNSTVLCTDCVKAIYTEAQQANNTISSSLLGKAIDSKCGSGFSNGSIPASISAPSSAASASASATGSSSSSSSAAPHLGELLRLTGPLGLGMAGLGLVFGGIAFLV